MEILIFLAVMFFLLTFNFIYDKHKMINTPKNKHRCVVPYEGYVKPKKEWQCYKCKAYWYVKHDSYGSYFVKRE
jgi:putative SOS response-associated peptidase YedK